MNKKSLSVTILIVFLLSGCVASRPRTGDKIKSNPAVWEGQTKQDILETYGKPYYKGGHKEVEVWYYPNQRMFVFFEGDKVVRIDVVTGEKI